MAGYKEHIGTSAMLGIGYGFATALMAGLTPIQASLAGWLTTIGGLLPDLDSPTSRPVRELFSLVAAIAPLLLAGHLSRWMHLPPQPETIMLLVIVLYLTIKYGGSELIKQLSTHRGMFHSLPAMLIASEIVYLMYPSDSVRIRLLMGLAVAIGFFSHLLLDEWYSVEVKGVRVRLKKSSGTAIKFSGTHYVANVTTYTLVLILSYGVLTELGWIAPDTTQPAATQMAEDPLESSPQTTQ